MQTSCMLKRARPSPHCRTHAWTYLAITSKGEPLFLQHKRLFFLKDEFYYFLRRVFVVAIHTEVLFLEWTLE